jgi:iron complex outermembrane receptor protein
MTVWGRLWPRLTLALGALAGCLARAADAESLDDLRRLQFEALLDVRVATVFRREERITEAPSAIQVITREDIQRSGATRIPEVLRLASNLQVAQIDSQAWAISARGFNGSLANKLLVMVDGRSVYSPLFAGVFWDVQNVFLDDVDRVEVISGPGATLWGANAVNGVINIVTRRARDTQGLLVSGGGGTELNAFGGVRYGGALSSNLFFRVYGEYFDRGDTVFPGGLDATNDWQIGHGGLRLDWEPSEQTLVTLQGDLYDGGNNIKRIGAVSNGGGHGLARVSHTLSEGSALSLQFYFDRARRQQTGSYDDELDTYDVDFQHNFGLGERQEITWGLGYRQFIDVFQGHGNLALVPSRLNHETYGGFVQDEISLVEDRLVLTAGTKLEHNDYTQFEVQPSARLAWQAAERQLYWVAVSRAVRTPSRADRDLFVPPAPPHVIAGGPDFQSEELLAYEAGLRLQPMPRMSLSLAAFYHDYDDLRSVERLDPMMATPSVVANLNRGESYGVEITADYRLTEGWRVWVGYTEMRSNIGPKSGSTDAGGTRELSDPDRQVIIRSFVDLPGNLQLDGIFRWVSELETTEVPAYSELDLRLAWRPSEEIELAVVGQNLLDQRHPEFGGPSSRQEVERGMYGKLTFWW